MSATAEQIVTTAKSFGPAKRIRRETRFFCDRFG